MNDRKMGNIGTTSGSNPVIVHGIFNSNIEIKPIMKGFIFLLLLVLYKITKNHIKFLYKITY